jgi:hypothetical protein
MGNGMGVAREVESGKAQGFGGDRVDTGGL